MGAAGRRTRETERHLGQYKSRDARSTYLEKDRSGRLLETARCNPKVSRPTTRVETDVVPARLLVKSRRQAADGAIAAHRSPLGIVPAVGVTRVILTGGVRRGFCSKALALGQTHSPLDARICMVDAAGKRCKKP